jgi:putative oxidoreductase
MARPNRYIPLLGRFLIGAPFMLSGIGKLAAHQATVGYLSNSALPLAQLAWRSATAVELAGGALILIGYRARPVAAVLAGFVLATAVLFHRDLGNQNELTHFLMSIMLAGGLLQIVHFGAGPLSIDAAGPLLLPRRTGQGPGDRVDFTTL